MVAALQRHARVLRQRHTHLLLYLLVRLLEFIDTVHGCLYCTHGELLLLGPLKLMPSRLRILGVLTSWACALVVFLAVDDGVELLLVQVKRVHHVLLQEELLLRCQVNGVLYVLIHKYKG